MTNEEFRHYMLFKLMDFDFIGFKYFVVDRSGTCYLYDDIPKLLNSDVIWEGEYKLYRQTEFGIDFNELDIDWKDTLVKL